jgi:hypothetical protein
MSTRTDRPRHHWWQHRGNGSTAVLDRDETTASTDARTGDPDLIDLRTPADRPVREARRDAPTERDFARDPESRTYRRQQAAAAATAAPVVTEPDHGTVVRDRVESTTPMYPVWGLERLGVMAIGAFLVVLGALTFARGDLNSSWYQPVVHVLSFDHTPIVGAAEVVAGALLLLSSLSSRTAALAAVVGILIIVGGAIVAAGEDPTKYATEDDFGWVLIGLGAGATLFAAPGLGMRRQRVLRDRVEAVR